MIGEKLNPQIENTTSDAAYVLLFGCVCATHSIPRNARLISKKPHRHPEKPIPTAAVSLAPDNSHSIRTLLKQILHKVTFSVCRDQARESSSVVHSWLGVTLRARLAGWA